MRILRFFCLILVLSVILSVSVFASDPVILAQPQDMFFSSTPEPLASITFSVLASGENLTYQWQSCTDSNGWIDFNVNSSSKTPTLSFQLSSSSFDSRVNGQVKYRCVISSEDGQTISSVVSTYVGFYLFGSLEQFLVFVNDTSLAIFSWVSDCCACIVREPFLLFTVGFLAVGACIALVSRLFARS